MTFPTPTPSRGQSQDVFDSAMGAFVAYLPTFEADVTAMAAAMNLNDTTDTSTSSVLIGLGAKTFTVSADKSFQPGMYLVVADVAAPSTNSMVVQVTSYSGTSLVTSAKAVRGSGTIASWVISLSAAAADIAQDIHAATDKVTPVGADELGIWDSVSGLLNRVSLTNLIANLTGGTIACSVYLSAASVTPSGLYKIPFDAEAFDIGGAYDAVTNYRFFPTTAGYYQCNWVVEAECDVGTMGVILSYLKKDTGVTHKGSESKVTQITGLGSRDYAVSIGSALVEFNGTTDYVELICIASGTAPAIIGGGLSHTTFSACIQRPS